MSLYKLKRGMAKSKLNFIYHECDREPKVSSLGGFRFSCFNVEIKGFFICVASRKGEVEVVLKIRLSLCHHMQSKTVLVKRKNDVPSILTLPRFIVRSQKHLIQSCANFLVIDSRLIDHFVYLHIIVSKGCSMQIYTIVS